MAVEIMTLADVCRGVAKRWTETYSDAYWKRDPEKAAIGRKLRALKNPTKEAIDKIIGNPSWTECACDCCGKEAPILAVFSGEYQEPVRMCPECLNEAASGTAARSAETSEATARPERREPGPEGETL